MKKTRKLRLGLVLLVFLLALPLHACASSISKFDAVAYMDGFIKAIYLGEFESSYLKMIDSTEAEARAHYEDELSVDVDNFVDWYDIEYPTDDFKEEIKELFREIYSHTKYKVVSAARQNDGSYSVKVEVEPINIIRLCEAEFDEMMAGFHEKYSPEQLDAMTDQEYEQADQEWAQLILELYRGKMGEIGNEPSQSAVLQLEKDKDGLYGLSDDDVNRLYDLIIDWSGPESAT